MVIHWNFDEWVRVKFKGKFKNKNGRVEGSRCSPYEPWRSRIDVIDNGGKKWIRNGKGENEIEKAHKKIGVPPTP